MNTAKEVQAFSICRKSTGKEIFKTSVPVYFFRATVEDSVKLDLDLEYYIHLVDGSKTETTEDSLDFHPLLMNWTDKEFRSVFIGLLNYGIITIHPSDAPKNDSWLMNVLSKHSNVDELTNTNTL